MFSLAVLGFVGWLDGWFWVFGWLVDWFFLFPVTQEGKNEAQKLETCSLWQFGY